MKMFCHLSTSEIVHTYENAYQETNGSINMSNLDIIGKKIDRAFKWYASNRSKYYLFPTNHE